VMSGLAEAVDKLLSLPECNTKWSWACRELVSLLRRYSTGLPLGMAADELIAALQAERRTETDPAIWVGEVLSVLAGDSPAWLMKMSGISRDRRVLAWQHSSHAALHVNSGIRLRIVSQALQMDPSAQLQLLAKIFPKNDDLQACSLEHAIERILLPSRHVVCEIALESDQTKTLPFPENGRELLWGSSLIKVWNTRNTFPDWVSGKIVSISHDSLRIEDIDGSTSTQHTVDVVLDPMDVAFSRLVNIGEFLLLRAPLVIPCGNSFTLRIASHTVLYVLPRLFCSLFHDPSTSRQSDNPDALAQLAVDTQPIKRRRVAASTLRVKDGKLVDLNCRITPTHVKALPDPGSEPAFDMLAIVLTTPEISSAEFDDEDCDFYVRLNLSEGLTVRLPTKRQVTGLEGTDIVAGHVLWLEKLRWVDDVDDCSAGEWTANSFVDVSSLRGVLWSPFVRRVVPVAFLVDSKIDRPDTVQVSCFILCARFELQRRALLLTIVDQELDSPKTSSNAFQTLNENGASDEIHCADVVATGLAVRRLLGFRTTQDFWDDEGADDRHTTTTAITGRHMIMSIATSVENKSGDADHYLNIVTAVSPGTRR
jgi:hypothetical protein